MQDTNVVQVLNAVFPNITPKVIGNTIKITIKEIVGTQLYIVSKLYLDKHVDNILLKRSGVNITIIITMK